MASSSLSVEPGQIVGGRYRLDRRLASGGMAEVWTASDLGLHRTVACKLLHRPLSADATAVERFRREAIAAASLSHPGIVSVYDTVAEPHHAGGPLHGIVMELVVGQTLRQYLNRHGTVPVGMGVSIGVAVAEALGAAHAAGIVHRDVKPANILLGTDGRILITDFGIAKAMATTDLTAHGMMVGTAKYLAPEQVEGHPVDGRTDLFSLGIVLFESLSGQVPFTGDSDAAVAMARLQEPAPPLGNVASWVPGPVAAVVDQVLSRDPDDRPRSARVLAGALRSAGSQVAARDDSGLLPRRRPADAPERADTPFDTVVATDAAGATIADAVAPATASPPLPELTRVAPRSSSEDEYEADTPVTGFDERTASRVGRVVAALLVLAVLLTLALVVTAGG